MSDYQPLRPYRVEDQDGKAFSTFTTEAKARLFIEGRVSGRLKLPSKTAWRLTKRLNKSGSKFELIDSGIT